MGECTSTTPSASTRSISTSNTETLQVVVGIPLDKIFDMDLVGHEWSIHLILEMIGPGCINKGQLF